MQGIGANRSDPEEAFDVKLASTGEVYTVQRGQSVIEALLDHGIEIPTLCLQGVCGTCMTEVLEGEPDHRDQYLTAEEKALNDRFTPCCSRSKTSLLIINR